MHGFLVGLDTEEAICHNQCLVGGAVDLYKCFDQLIRLLLYLVLAIAGIPRGILNAYISYHENVSCYFMLLGCIGMPFRFACSIPQGCPLSMLFVSLLLRPWLVMVAQMGVQPRALADDLLIVATGPDSLVRFANAFQASVDHLIALGGNIANKKSTVFSNNSNFRAGLT